jgi:hypothetical protein
LQLQLETGTGLKMPKMPQYTKKKTSVPDEKNVVPIHASEVFDFMKNLPLTLVANRYRNFKLHNWPLAAGMLSKNL